MKQPGNSREYGTRDVIVHSESAERSGGSWRLSAKCNSIDSDILEHSRDVFLFFSFFAQYSRRVRVLAYWEVGFLDEFYEPQAA